MMTPERFAQLADAYGANLDRWPATEQREARSLLENDNARVHEAIRQASELDGMLDLHRLPSADPAFARAIRLSAPPPESSSQWLRYLGWLSPFGVVSVGVAGIVTGMLVASLSQPLPHLQQSVLPSVFDQGDAEFSFTIDAEEDE